MPATPKSSNAAAALVAAAVLCLTGCTGAREYVHNGFKVGPNYCPPAAPVAQRWIDANDQRIVQQSDSICVWWTVFSDQKLNDLVATAYQQNLTLREAGFRVLEARAQLAIVRGEFFPQTQNMTGSYRRDVISLNPPTSGAVGSRAFSQWAFGFNLAWELDFWGRFRRAITEQEDLLEASVHNYDQVLVTLLGDLASAYVQIRTDQERIRLLRKNLKLQQVALNYAMVQLKGGRSTQVNLNQVLSTVKQTEAQIPPLEIDLRQTNDRLCVLLGIPAVDLLTDPRFALGAADIPVAPPEVVVGIPADLLRRRPDVRAAERNAMAQAEQIGIAEAALYPAFSINGSLGYAAQDFSHLFTSQAFNGSVGPSFQWNILNYGRLINNVRLQDAHFQELIATYQATVLQANADVEDGLVTFLRAHEREELLNASAIPLRDNVAILSRQLGLTIDYTTWVVTAQNLVTQEDLWAQARGQIAQGLIQVYRAVGGGWQYRGQATPPAEPPVAPGAAAPVAPPPVVVAPGPAPAEKPPAVPPKPAALPAVPKAQPEVVPAP